MSDQQHEGLFIDSDWKEQAKRDKERLAAEEEARRADAEQGPDFREVIDLLAMQAMLSMGMLGGPDEGRLPINLPAARHFIDLLSVLQEKTQGNLDDQEKKDLDDVLYRLQMAYVQIANRPLRPGGGASETGTKPGVDPAV